jgi:hypothetical protein
MRDNVYTTSQRPVVLVESLIRPENRENRESRENRDDSLGESRENGEFKPHDANKRKPRAKKAPIPTLEVKKEGDEVFFGKKVIPETKRKPKSPKTS